MKNSIVEKTKAAGVVGAGGAGFPTHVKIDAAADTVLINGASCEPLLSSDISLMEQRPEEVVRGLELVMKSVTASKGIICVKKKHGTCIAILQKEIEARDDIAIFPMDDFYPAGDEHIMVNEALGRIVPEGGIPLEVGAVVCNVETVFNVSRAMNDIPVTHRTLNVAGEVGTPSILRVPIGMPVSEVIALAGGMIRPDCRVIDGGPMMGHVLDDPDSAYVSKTTSGLLVFPAQHNVIQGKITNIAQLARMTRVVCCQCTLCTELCPRYQLGHNLHPHLIMRSLHQPGEHPIKKEALLCSECGICEKWACPMHISPREVNAYLKKKYRGNPKEVGKGQLCRHKYMDLRRVPTKRLEGKLDILSYSKTPRLSLEETSCNKVGLYLKQHIGSPASVLVKQGDRVHKGQCVAVIPDGRLGANLHASINGQAIRVQDDLIILTGE